MTNNLYAKKAIIRQTLSKMTDDELKYLLSNLDTIYKDEEDRKLIRQIASNKELNKVAI